MCLTLDKKDTANNNNVWTVPLILERIYFFARKIVKINLPACLKMLSAYY
jgi:hypothetical protein